jgi:hypothetical protein
MIYIYNTQAIVTTCGLVIKGSLLGNTCKWQVLEIQVWVFKRELNHHDIHHGATFLLGNSL